MRLLLKTENQLQLLNFGIKEKDGSAEELAFGLCWSDSLREFVLSSTLPDDFIIESSANGIKLSYEDSVGRTKSSL